MRLNIAAFDQLFVVRNASDRLCYDTLGNDKEVNEVSIGNLIV